MLVLVLFTGSEIGFLARSAGISSFMLEPPIMGTWSTGEFSRKTLQICKEANVLELMKILMLCEFDIIYGKMAR